MLQNLGLDIKRIKHSTYNQPAEKIACLKKKTKMKIITLSTQHSDKKFNLNFKQGLHHKKEGQQLTPNQILLCATHQNIKTTLSKTINLLLTDQQACLEN